MTITNGRMRALIMLWYHLVCYGHDEYKYGQYEYQFTVRKQEGRAFSRMKGFDNNV